MSNSAIEESSLSKHFLLSTSFLSTLFLANTSLNNISVYHVDIESVKWVIIFIIELNQFYFLIATGGDDYASTIESISIPPEETNMQHCVNIDVISDDNVEDNETFSVSIDSTDQAVQFTQSSTTVVIIDVPPSKSPDITVIANV